jgi:uncharacterized membrane protein
MSFRLMPLVYAANVFLWLVITWRCLRNFKRRRYPQSLVLAVGCVGVSFASARELRWLVDRQAVAVYFLIAFGAGLVGTLMVLNVLRQERGT